MSLEADQLKANVAEFESRHDYTAEEQGLVLAEETGELCEAILRYNGKKIHKDKVERAAIREEIGDVIFTACTIAQIHGIDPVFCAARRSQVVLDRDDTDDGTGNAP